MVGTVLEEEEEGKNAWMRYASSLNLMGLAGG
jgi:hypothetical protein